MDYSWVYANTQEQYVMAFAIIVGTILIIEVFKRYVLHRLRSLSKKTKNDIDDFLIDFVSEIKWPIVLFVAFYLGAKSLMLPGFADTVLDYMMLIFGAVYAVKVVNAVIDYATRKQITKRGEEEASLVRVLNRLAKGFVWLVGILLILSNMGVNVTSLIAGLGVGGIAIAFALQKILEDIFSSFSIYFDKPFTVGDFIVIGEDSGTVQHIGLKSTRIKHLKGHELVVSNRDLTNSRIHNYKRMENRRIVFSFGVTYNTSSKKLDKINAMVKDIINNIGDAELERVHFKELGGSALVYEVVYFVQTSDYNEYMDIQENINLQLIKRFTKEKIEFAYPTQTVFVHQE